MSEYNAEVEKLIDRLSLYVDVIKGDFAGTTPVVQDLIKQLVEASIEYGRELGIQDVVDSPLDYIELSSLAPERE